LPVHRATAAPIQSSNSAIAPAIGSPTQPVYQPGELTLDPNFVSREEAWQKLGANLRQRVDSRIGSLIEWWAGDVDSRSYAVVLGTHALITVTPTVNTSGKPAHELRTFPLGGGNAFRVASVVALTTSGTASTPTHKIEPGQPVRDTESMLSQR